MSRLLILLMLISLAAPAAAQVGPGVAGGDARLQTMAYDPGRVVRLRVPLGYQTTLILDPNESIENIAVGDSDAWQITPNARGDHLFIKPVQAGGTTNLTVVTDIRVYSFELAATNAPASDTPFTVRFLYPDATPSPSQAGPSAPAVMTSYRLSGNRRIRPTAVSDDGVHTSIRWALGQEMPAVFALDARNREVLVTGYVREDLFVIDAVYSSLIFRLDRQVARATRVEKEDDR